MTGELSWITEFAIQISKRGDQKTYIFGVLWILLTCETDSCVKIFELCIYLSRVVDFILLIFPSDTVGSIVQCYSFDLFNIEAWREAWGKSGLNKIGICFSLSWTERRSRQSTTNNETRQSWGTQAPSLRSLCYLLLWVFLFKNSLKYSWFTMLC